MAVLYDQQRTRLVRLDEARSLVQVIGHVSRFVEAMADIQKAKSLVHVGRAELESGLAQSSSSERVAATATVARERGTYNQLLVSSEIQPGQVEALVNPTDRPAQLHGQCRKSSFRIAEDIVRHGHTGVWLVKPVA